MNKYLKRGLIIAVVLAAVLYGGYLFMIAQTKSYSPEETVHYNLNGYDIEVFYNRPYKKDRNIFGGLVPYGRVWRTGANEATTFETNQDLNIGGDILPAGKYTLWTIPEAEYWTIIFNSKQYSWGVDRNGVSREAEHDVMQVRVPASQTPEVKEQFTIALEDVSAKPVLTLAWDQTLVWLPLDNDSEGLNR